MKRRKLLKGIAATAIAGSALKVTPRSKKTEVRHIAMNQGDNRRSYHFDGKIDEVMFSETQLTAADFTYSYWVRR